MSALERLVAALTPDELDRLYLAFMHAANSMLPRDDSMIFDQLAREVETRRREADRDR